ncbi:hypothetical protein AX16_005922 [Volvariella volvacea WC 439]|nr:hypothetical protein AX16_005922 [Volvariella volvacea WC 439]
MGGGNDTKKSFAEVQQDLQNRVLDNTRTLLRNDFGINAASSWQLEEILNQIASHRFQSRFGFTYDDDPSRCNPPGSLGAINPIAKLCSITDPLSDQAKYYVEEAIFSKANLPSWVTANAKADIVTLASGFLNADTNEQWEYSEYTKAFDAAIEDQNSWKVRAVFVYVNGSLSEDGLNANLCVIYFMGVYYNTESEAKAARDSLQAEAYTIAQNTAGIGSPIKSDRDLSDVLLKYGKTLFQSKFSFEYGGTPPDYPQDARTSSITYGGYLCYFPDLDEGNTIPALVKNEIFSGINIPIQSIKNQAIWDVTNEFQSLLQVQSKKTWDHVFVGNDYGIHDPSINPIQQRGLIFYFYDSAITEGGVTVSISYIYYMAMFYEIYPPDIKLKRDLLVDLCTNLYQHLSGGSPPSTDALALQEYLTDYAKQQFKQNFGFEYANGAPPDQKGKTVRRFSALCNPTAYPPGPDEVTQFMTNELFDDKYAGFPPYARVQIYNNVLRNFNNYLAIGTQIDANNWYTAHDQNYYDDPAGQKDTVHEYGIYIYALGDKLEEGERLQRGYVFYFAVYCACDKSHGGAGLS